MINTRLKHVAWRDGRPRFVPSRTLRMAGWTGEDLRHEDGRWFTFGEAIDWSHSRDQEIQRRRAEQKGKKVRLYKTPKDPKRPGYVYFLRSGANVKIGWSEDPIRRAGDMLTALSAPIEKMLFLPGTRQDEKVLHRKFAAVWLSGEWFKSEPDLVRESLSMFNKGSFENAP